MRKYTFLAGLLSAALLTACSGRHTAQDAALQPSRQAPPVLSAGLSESLAHFPAPSSLPRSASGPPSDQERSVFGGGWYSGLPNNNMSSENFLPAWTPGLPHPLTDAAYATFQFANMAGYGGKQRVKLQWETAPALADTFVGVANYVADRWDWFKPSVDFAVELGDLAPYSGPAEQMQVCVLVLGTTFVQLNNIVVGDSFINYVGINTDLNADPTLNIAPLTVQFGALNTDCFGGTVVSWDWDWESDGTYDVTDDSNGQEIHVYPPGTWTMTVRATDDEGATGTGSLTFVAVNPNNQPPTAVFDTTETTGDAPLLSYFNAQTSFDPDGTIIKFEWDFDGDNEYEVDNGSVLDALHTFGRKGLTLVRLRVTDNDLATDTQSVAIILDSGWRDTTIDNNAVLNPSYKLSTAVMGNASKLPCVTYMNWDTKMLRFASAQSADGSSWNAPVEPVSGTGWIGFSASVITLVNGVPLLAYGIEDLSTGHYSQHVVRATDDSASAWNLPVLVGAGDNAGQGSSMILLNTIPAIASQVGNSQSNSHINFYLAENADGTSWHAGQLAVGMFDNCMYSSVSLLTSGSGVFKHPALLFWRSNGSEIWDAGYTRATDLEGTAWSTPVIFPQVRVGSTAGLQIGGQPALLAGFPQIDGQLFYARAEDADGSSWGAWKEIGHGGDGNLVLYNGKPAACYYDTDLRQLDFVTAVDAQGSAWNPPYAVDTVEDTGRCCSMVVNNGAPVICYYDHANQRLKAAYWE